MADGHGHDFRNIPMKDGIYLKCTRCDQLHDGQHSDFCPKRGFAIELADEKEKLDHMWDDPDNCLEDEPIRCLGCLEVKGEESESCPRDKRRIGFGLPFSDPEMEKAFQAGKFPDRWGQSRCQITPTEIPAKPSASVTARQALRIDVDSCGVCPYYRPGSGVSIVSVEPARCASDGHGDGKQREITGEEDAAYDPPEWCPIRGMMILIGGPSSA